ncbi:MAG TPA: flagellar biosynthesis protein FliQ [Acidobacteriota bacterium]|nr:flagellar biosynthesis protein FliQ [Acidobacteriota bacterium]
MTEANVVEMLHGVGMQVLWLSGPLLLVGLVVGLLISVAQVVTSIHDPTLSFVPRIIVVLVMALILLSWMINRLVSFTINLFDRLPGLV